MPRINFTGSDGERNELEVSVGQTLMEAAIDNNVAGIVAECGGACACATCHAYVAAAWAEKVPAIDDMENAMLDSVLERRAGSRLACRIKVTEALDGLEIQAADNES